VKKLFCMLMAIVFALVFVLPVFAGQLEEYQSKKKSLDSQLSDVYNREKKAESRKNELENKRDELIRIAEEQNKEYQAMLDEINSIEGQITVVEQALKEAIEKYMEQKEILKVRLRVMYESSNMSYFEMLAKSKSIMDFFETLELIRTISKRDEQLVCDLAACRNDIDYKRELMVSQKIQKEEVASAREETLNATLASRAETEQEIRASEEELRRLEQREDELLTLSSQTVEIIKDLQKMSGYAGGTMAWPSSNSRSISSSGYFGFRIHPIYRTRKMHTGIDINASYGTSILAANSGTVILSGYSGGYGYRVVVDHGGGISTLYAHCSRLLVKAGDNVEKGDTIAKVGSTGLSTGPHLHFEVRKDGVPKNPLEWVKQ
jgi:murein DD-endopeptidase MepM/ murein hydrolase activator NlpD